MTADGTTTAKRNEELETFAAELTLAAYRAALRTRKRGSWLDLELALWRAIGDTVKTWERALPGCPEPVILPVGSSEGGLP
jgi:hypothetical protein